MFTESDTISCATLKSCLSKVTNLKRSLKSAYLRLWVINWMHNNTKGRWRGRDNIIQCNIWWKLAMRLKSSSSHRCSLARMSKSWWLRRMKLLTMLFLWTRLILCSILFLWIRFTQLAPNNLSNPLNHSIIWTSTVAKSTNQGQSTSCPQDTICHPRYSLQPLAKRMMTNKKKRQNWLTTWKGLLPIKPFLNTFLKKWKKKKCIKIHMTSKCLPTIWWVRVKHLPQKMFSRGLGILTRKVNSWGFPKICQSSLTMLRVWNKQRLLMNPSIINMRKNSKRKWLRTSQIKG